MSTTSAVLLLTQGPETSVSGGFRYNRHMVEGLRNRGIFVKVSSPNTEKSMISELNNIKEDTRIVVDSIAAMRFIDAMRSVDLLPNTQVVYLCHLPISFDVSTRTPVMDNKLAQAEREMLDGSNMAIATSHFTEQWLAKVNGEIELKTIHPGVDSQFKLPSLPQRDKIKNAAESTPTRNDGKSLLCVANLLPNKGQLELITALADLGSLNWSITFVAGRDVIDNDYEHALKSFIQEHGLEDRTHFKFNLTASDLAKVYQDADLFVLLTYFETYGMALSEARASGLPVIVSKTGGVRESTHPPSTVYVDMEDHQQLTETLARCLSDSNYLRELRYNALQHNQCRDWSVVVDEIQEALNV